MSVPKSCLLIGAAGFVGSALAEAVCEQGWELHSATRDNYDTFIGRHFDVILNANGNARRFLAEREPLADFRASAESVYRSCLDFSCESYAYISTVDVYNDPSRVEQTSEDSDIDPLQLGAYAFHKWLAERFVMRSKSQWRIFRLAQMVGPGLRKGPVFDLLHGERIWIHDDSQLHYMNTRSVARVVLTLLDATPVNEIFNVCGVGSIPFRRVRALFPEQANQPNDGEQSQAYDIDTSKTARLVELPKSWDEVSSFVRGQLAERPDDG